MIIDADLNIPIGDGVVIMEEPSLRDWAFLMELSEKKTEEQADMIVSKVKGVAGFKYSNGADVTVEDIKAKKFPARFLISLINGWTAAILQNVNGGAQEKNEQMAN